MSLKFKGLSKFVHEIKNCDNQEEEFLKMEKQASKIREIFSSKEKLSSYKTKKNIWKLIFIKLMGLELNIELSEIISLLTSNRFSDKYTGYIAMSVLNFSSHSAEINKNIQEQIKNDLFSKNENFQSLALCFIGSVAPQDLAIPLVNNVLKLSLGDNGEITFSARKKALLVLLRIYKRYPQSFENIRNWIQPLNTILEKFTDISLLSAAVTIIEGIISINYKKSWDVLATTILKLLSRIRIVEITPEDYQYHGVPHPWLQMKCLKCLCYFPVQSDKLFTISLNNVFREIITGINITSTKSKNNVEFSILFEAINLVVKYRYVIDPDSQQQIITLIFLFLELPEPNIQYLTFDAIITILGLPGSQDLMKKYYSRLLSALNDLDISMRRRTLDLVYALCNSENVGFLVEELLNYADECDFNLKEELIFKIAILSEKFAPDLKWYLDVVIRLLTNSGDYINDDIWWRLSQVLKGFGSCSEKQSDLQSYAVGATMISLKATLIHEKLIKLASFIISEFGISNDLSLIEAFEVLKAHFYGVSNETKTMLLDSYLKIALNIILKKESSSEEKLTLNKIESIFQQHIDHIDVELQKRAFEGLVLLKIDNSEVLKSFLKPLPSFSNILAENNPLITKMMKLVEKTQKVSNDQTLRSEKLKLFENLNTKNIRTENNVISDERSGGKNNIDDYDLFIKEEKILSKYESTNLFERCRKRLALQGLHILTTPPFLEYPAYCLKEFKNILINKEGILFSDSLFQIEFQSESKESQIVVLLTFRSKTGPLKVTSIKLDEQNGLNFNVSPVKHGETSQIRILFSNISCPISFPSLQVLYNINAVDKMISILIPIFVHNFLTSNILCQSDYFDTYTKFTLNNDFFKLDEFIRNPAVEQPLVAVMKKIGNILKIIMNFYINYYPGESDMKIIYGSATLNTNNGSIAPATILIEIECFEEAKEFLRISIRNSQSPLITRSIYQIINLFMIPYTNQ